MSSFNHSLSQSMGWQHDDTLLRLASLWTSGGPTEKTAIVPAGGDPNAMPPGGDPSGGGAPPDPSAGGGAPPAAPAPAPAPAPLDPSLIQAVSQAVMQQLGGAGGAGGAAGAGGMAGKSPKKAEDAIRDAKMFAIDAKLTAIMNHLSIAMPPEATLGAPPDPTSAQAAAQEHASASGVPSDPATSAAPPAPAGVAPVDPMSAGQGPIGGGKMASIFGEPWSSGSIDFDMFHPEPEPSVASRIRGIMGNQP